MSVREFSIDVSDETLKDLKSRLQSSRFSPQLNEVGWNNGTSSSYMREFLAYWLEEYDWRAQERYLNNLMPQYIANIEGVDLHFVHKKSLNPNALTLVMTHGWPGSFFEFHKVLEPLVHPEKFGGQISEAFDVLCPSLAGYAWSKPVYDQPCDVVKIAERQLQLLQLLEIKHFGLQGGDWGGLVSPYMALQSDSAVGLHLNSCTTRSTDDPTEAKLQGVVTGRSAVSIEYYREQKGYAVIQSLKPDQLAFGLNDSPLGLAAWIIQCFYMWSDHEGDLESRFTKDELITNIMIYWVTQSMPTAIRLYRESLLAGTFGPPKEYIRTPTGVALFKDIPIPKKEWAEEHYNICHWNEMSSGGHFAALEEPEQLIKDIRAFFGQLT